MARAECESPEGATPCWSINHQNVYCLASHTDTGTHIKLQVQTIPTHTSNFKYRQYRHTHQTSSTDNTDTHIKLQVQTIQTHTHSSVELVRPTLRGGGGPPPGKILELSSNSLILGTFWHEIGIVLIMRSAMNYGT